MSSQDQNKGDSSTLGGLLSGKTFGVQNIEAAYSRAGASAHHTPGSATKLGSQDQKGASEHQGIGSEKFSNSISDQRQEVCRLLLPESNWIRLTHVAYDYRKGV